MASVAFHLGGEASVPMRSLMPSFRRIRCDSTRGRDEREALLRDDCLFPEPVDLRRLCELIQRNPDIGRCEPFKVLPGCLHVREEREGHGHRFLALRLREYQRVDPIRLYPGDRGEVQTQAHGPNPSFLKCLRLPTSLQTMLF